MNIGDRQLKIKVLGSLHVNYRSIFYVIAIITLETYQKQQAVANVRHESVCECF
jgi:hypothetical protein